MSTDYGSKQANDLLGGAVSSVPASTPTPKSTDYGSPQINALLGGTSPAPEKGATPEPFKIEPTTPLSALSKTNDFMKGFQSPVVKTQTTTPATNLPKPDSDGNEYNIPSTLDEIGSRKEELTQAPQKSFMGNIVDNIKDFFQNDNGRTDASMILQKSIVNTQLVDIGTQLGIDKQFPLNQTQDSKTAKYNQDKQIANYVKQNWETIRQSLTDPNALPDHPEMLGPKFSEVSKNLDAITKELGIRDTPTNKEVLTMTLTAPIMVGVVEAGAIPTGLTLAGWAAFSWAEHKILGDSVAGKLADKLGIQNENVKDAMDLIEMFGTGYALHTGILKAPEFAVKWTKNITETYMPGQKIIIDGKSIQEHFGGKVFDQVINDAKLTPDQIRTARKGGIVIDVPPEKIVSLVDKPYWSKIKQFLNVTKGTEPKVTSSVKGGETKQGAEIRPNRLLGTGDAKTQEGAKILHDEIKTSIEKNGEDFTHMVLQEQLGISANEASDLMNGVKSSKTPEELKALSDALLPKEEPKIEPKEEKPVDAEKEATEMVKKDLPGLVDKYLEKNGNLINTDEARELFPSYSEDRSKSADVHESASTVAKEAYKKLLTEKAGTGNNTVLFTAGGTGAGKTVSLKNSGLDLTEYPIIFDTNVNNLDSASKKIDMALEKGYDVNITYVHNDIHTSLENAMSRSEIQAKELGTGRTVPIEEQINTHFGASEAIPELHSKYLGNKRVEFRAIDNEGNVGKGFVEDPIDFIKSKRYDRTNENITHKKLEQQVTNAHKEGRISDRTKSGFLEGSKRKGTGGRNSESNGKRSEKPKQDEVKKPEPTPGEKKQTGLAKSVEEKALEEKLELAFKDTSEYSTITIKDQAEKALKLISEDYELAKQIAFGHVNAPGDLKNLSVFTAVETKAIKDGDTETLLKLAESSIGTELSESAQNLRLAAERYPDSPVRAIREVTQAREKAAKERVKKPKEAKAKVVKEIKSQIKKVAPNKETWMDFVQSITC